MHIFIKKTLARARKNGRDSNNNQRDQMMITIGKLNLTNDYRACIRSIKMSWFNHYVRYEARTSQLPPFSASLHATKHAVCVHLLTSSRLSFAVMHFLIFVSPHLSHGVFLTVFFLHRFFFHKIWLNSSYASACVQGKKLHISAIVNESVKVTLHLKKKFEVSAMKCMHNR